MLNGIIWVCKKKSNSDLLCLNVISSSFNYIYEYICLLEKYIEFFPSFSAFRDTCSIFSSLFYGLFWYKVSRPHISKTEELRASIITNTIKKILNSTSVEAFYQSIVNSYIMNLYKCIGNYNRKYASFFFL